jgi:hypothetical protein
LKGHAQSYNHGADVFVADLQGHLRGTSLSLEAVRAWGPRQLRRAPLWPASLSAR